MLKNMFKAMVLSTKIYNVFKKELGLEEIDSIDFQGCDIYVTCTYITVDNCKGNLYKIPFGKINGKLIDRDDIYNGYEDFPDWVVCNVEDLYTFLKA